MSVVVGSVGGGMYAQAVAMAALLQKYSDRLRVTIVPGWSTGKATALMQDGKVDFAVTSSIIGPDVFAGTGPWKERGPFPDMRVGWATIPAVICFLTLEELPIESLYELKGKGQLSLLR